MAVCDVETSMLHIMGGIVDFSEALGRLVGDTRHYECSDKAPCSRNDIVF